jgi:hypothetical protein
MQNRGTDQAHFCKHCKTVTINGTKVGEDVKQQFEYPISKVKLYAQEKCDLFKWAFQLLHRNTDAQIYLVLSILTDSEDLQFLNASWRDQRNDHVEGDKEKQTSFYKFAQEGILYIFAEEGSLSRTVFL